MACRQRHLQKAGTPFLRRACRRVVSFRVDRPHAPAAERAYQRTKARGARPRAARAELFPLLAARHHAQNGLLQRHDVRERHARGPVQMAHTWRVDDAWTTLPASESTARATLGEICSHRGALPRVLRRPASPSACRLRSSGAARSRAGMLSCGPPRPLLPPFAPSSLAQHATGGAVAHHACRPAGRAGPHASPSTSQVLGRFATAQGLSGRCQSQPARACRPGRHLLAIFKNC
jgi:hypothetical protein